MSNYTIVQYIDYDSNNMSQNDTTEFARMLTQVIPRRFGAREVRYPTIEQYALGSDSLIFCFAFWRASHTFLFTLAFHVHIVDKSIIRAYD